MRLQKGFTLIELAVVIAIIAVLAAAAMPKLMDASAQAELSTIQDFKATLASSAAMYTSAQSTSPVGFTDYVTTTSTVNKPFTISTFGFGPKGVANPCTVAAGTINCTTQFNKWTAVYNWNNGSVTGTATPTASNTMASTAIHF